MEFNVKTKRQPHATASHTISVYYY
ncbi:uncharacterized protein G2W53_037522 [Senna tora]|uniref:Uncharacterized protein n=1 Tax=Senna tora TaxID=362788 RepID=A0A834SL25_9FABA|nr:uncharacterized protein G2W53_037522 [Senna tora]